MFLYKNGIREKSCIFNCHTEFLMSLSCRVLKKLMRLARLGKISNTSHKSVDELSCAVSKSYEVTGQSTSYSVI